MVCSFQVYTQAAGAQSIWAQYRQAFPEFKINIKWPQITVLFSSSVKQRFCFRMQSRVQMTAHFWQAFDGPTRLYTSFVFNPLFWRDSQCSCHLADGRSARSDGARGGWREIHAVCVIASLRWRQLFDHDRKQRGNLYGLCRWTMGWQG